MEDTRCKTLFFSTAFNSDAVRDTHTSGFLLNPPNCNLPLLDPPCDQGASSAFSSSLSLLGAATWPAQPSDHFVSAPDTPRGFVDSSSFVNAVLDSLSDVSCPCKVLAFLPERSFSASGVPGDGDGGRGVAAARCMNYNGSAFP